MVNKGYIAGMKPVATAPFFERLTQVFKDKQAKSIEIETLKGSKLKLVKLTETNEVTTFLDGSEISLGRVSFGDLQTLEQALKKVN